ncbi:glycosyltransferase family 9 protein [Salinimicrobium sp. GXAS 041]|uniref:glycosyltransferase family 9 protein n=1 Tax=Salinimicrobium sp. GXAS 041 TaxID=3400806 RepID=UPI003C7155C8
MSVFKKLNPVRRKVMHSLTRNIGKSSFPPVSGALKKGEIKRILIIRPNHRLGNLLLVTPLIQEIEQTFPKCKIDVFLKGNLGPIVLQNYKSVDKIPKLPRKPFKQLFQYGKSWVDLKKHRYDIVVNIDKGSSSGTLATKFANADLKFFGNMEEDRPFEAEKFHMAKFPVYHFRECISRLGYSKNKKPVPSLNLELSTSEIAAGKKILDELVKNNKKTIAIFTFATGRKRHSEEWWKEVYGSLLKKFADEYNIVEVLPVENVSRIDFKAPSFYSKDIREIGAFIHNTAVFIGADSGIMHLASASGTPTLGLFSCTNPDRYAPYNHGSMAVNTNTTSTEELIKLVGKALTETQKEKILFS